MTTSSTTISPLPTTIETTSTMLLATSNITEVPSATITSTTTSDSTTTYIPTTSTTPIIIMPETQLPITTSPTTTAINTSMDVPVTKSSTADSTVATAELSINISTITAITSTTSCIPAETTVMTPTITTTSEVPTTTSSSKATNITEIKKMQDIFISFYERYRPVEVSVLLDEKCDIKTVYVDPVIQEKDIRKENQEVTEKNISWSDSKMVRDVTSFRQIFYRKDGCSRLNRIYLCGKAGLGKTTFCRKVLHTWCNVKQNIKDDKNSAFQDSDVLQIFDMVFYIDLREISDETDLVQVICAQDPLKSHSDKSSVSIVLDILDTLGDKILFIMDGVDELPRKATFLKDIVNCRKYAECCFFISSNPSHIYEMKLNVEPETDLMLDVRGFSHENAIKCAKQIVETCEGKVRVIDQFVKEIEDNILTKELMNEPLLHRILVQSCCDHKRSLPKKRDEIYISLCNLLAERCMKKYAKDPAAWQKKLLQGHHVAPLPGKLSDMSLVKMCGESFIVSLSNVAHHIFLMNNKKNTLVFEETELLAILGDDGQKKLDLAQDINLISLITYGSYTTRRIKLCFLHKTVQEFFTAVYFMINPEKLEKFVSSLTNLDDVLQSENIIVFLVGLSSPHGNKVLAKVCEVCNEDEEVVQYREGTSLPSERLENIMKMYKRCLEEAKGVDVSLNLSDLSQTEFDVHTLHPECCKSLDLRIQLNDSCVPLNLEALTKLSRLSLRYYSDGKVHLSTSTALTALTVVLNAPDLKVLCMMGPSNRSDRKYFRLHVPKMIELSELRLCNVTLSSSACNQLIMNLTQSTKLSMLQIEETDLRNCKLNLTKLTVLSSLILRRVKLSSSCCDVLGRTLIHCIKLVTLRIEDIDLHNCQLDLSLMRKLSELNLVKVAVSISGQKKIDSSITKLESLNILSKKKKNNTMAPTKDRYKIYITRVYISQKKVTVAQSRYKSLAQ